MRPPLLTPEKCATALEQLDSWESDGVAIWKTFTAKSFSQGISWVDAIAQIAERMDHHPDIDIRWTSIKVRLTTHDRSGLTQLDIDQAKAIDEICQ